MNSNSNSNTCSNSNSNSNSILNSDLLFKGRDRSSFNKGLKIN